MEIEILEEKLFLAYEKCLIWQRYHIAFIADIHLGKSTHFRKAGLAVPSAIIHAEINRLKELISKYSLEKIYFLGDLFHSHHNIEWDYFNIFRRSFQSIEFILVRGNHDILPKKQYLQTKIKVVAEPYKLNSFYLSHHPMSLNKIPENFFNICGHIHPGGVIKGKAKESMKFPCFLVKSQQMILPAFGSFTGLAIQADKKKESIFAVLNKKVVKIH